MATNVSEQPMAHRNWRSAMALIAIFAVLLTTVTLAQSSSANAQPVSCTQGTQVGLSCKINGNPPVAGIGCAVSATVFQDSGECFSLVRPIIPSGGPCQGPYVPLEGSGPCSVTNPSADPSFICPSPASGLEAFAYVAKDNRDLIIRCVQAPTSADCLASQLVTPHTDGSQCRRTVELRQASLCDDGYSPLGDTECVRYELADGINLSCPLGTLVGTTCEIDRGFARRFEPVCPIGDPVQSDGDECFVLEPLPASGTCDVSTTADPVDPTQCRRPVDLRPGDAFCDAGQIYTNAQRCFEYDVPVGYPDLDCAGTDAGAAICLTTVHYAQPNSEMLANTPTTVSYYSCSDGTGQWSLRARNSSELASSTAGVLSETVPGMYEATFVAPAAGNFEMLLLVRCGNDPAAATYDYPLFNAGPTCNGLTPTLWATAGQPLFGTDANEVIMGTSGPDMIDAGGGDDTICGLGGNDVIIAGAGNDAVAGGTGNDVIRGNSGEDILAGLEGNDRIFGGTGNDELNGGEGDDYLGGFGGADQIVGGLGADIIFGGFGADNIHGGQGDDVIRGLVGDDVIRGGDGNDELNGDRGNDFIQGGSGDDVINGGNANDQLAGESGNDEVNGGRADDQLSGGDGIDTCAGNLHLVGDVASADCETTFGVP